MTFRQSIPTASRLALGSIFLVFGLNGFFNFIPQPAPPSEALAFLGGLAGSGYFFPLLKGTEVVAGALLLAGRFVPLALTVLAPIVLNIVAFHAFLAPAGMGIAAAVLAAEVALAWFHRDAFRGVLAARAVPRAPGARALAGGHEASAGA